MAVGIAIASINALTNASLRSSALELSGTIKFAYDRAIMARHTERLSLDLDKGLIWLDFTEDTYSLARERHEGREGVKSDAVGEDDAKAAKKKERDSFFSDEKDAEKEEVKIALEGGKAVQFAPDVEAMDRPKALPSDIRISKVWSGHQEEAFTSGTAYVHFFNSGWSEPAQIELTDGDEFVTIKVYPLTGRVRIYEKELEVPKPESDDGREEGDE